MDIQSPGSFPSILGKRKTPPPPTHLLFPSNPMNPVAVHTPPAPVNGEVVTTESADITTGGGIVAEGNQQNEIGQT